MILWLVTAAAGVYLLRAGGATRRLAAAARATAVSEPARIGAIPLAEGGGPPPVPHARVATPPGEHPLLEFSHPALAITGCACWFMFTFVHYRPLAWIAFAILVVTIGAGLGWLARTKRETGQRDEAGWDFPPRLIAMHGLAAAVSITLTVLTALSASHP